MDALLIRHGHTVLNDSDTYFSTRDPGLSEKGLEQADCLAKLLQHIDIAAVFSSPLQRARQTAQVLAEAKDLAVGIDERLRELDTGAFEGLNAEALRSRDPDFLQRWRTSPADLVWPRGESLRMAGQRVVDCVQEKMRTFRHDTVAFVGHGIAIKAALCLLSGLDPGRFRDLRLATASYAHLRFEPGRVTVVAWHVDACAPGNPGHPVPAVSGKL